MSAFPGVVKPISEVSGDLMSHLRYPEDLFKVQREVLGRYHVTDPGAFFIGQDYWQTPDDPTKTGAETANQPPYYLTLQMPGQDTASFSLTSTYIPRSTTENVSNVLTGFVAVDADAGGQTGEKAEGYGTMRLLQLPRNNAVSGPGQVQNEFNSDEAQNELNIRRQGNSSRVTNGNLLTLPIGGGLLYVQPVYFQSQGETSYPLLQRVLVAFGEEIGYAPTLDEALDQVFGGDSGATAGDADAAGGGGGGTTGGEPGTNLDAQQRLRAALETARQAIVDGQTALAAQDFGAYGDAQDALKKAVEDAAAAEAEIAGGGATPAPAP